MITQIVEAAFVEIAMLYVMTVSSLARGAEYPNKRLKLSIADLGSSWVDVIDSLHSDMIPSRRGPHPRKVVVLLSLTPTKTHQRTRYRKLWSMTFELPRQASI